MKKIPNTYTLPIIIELRFVELFQKWLEIDLKTLNQHGISIFGEMLVNVNYYVSENCNGQNVNDAMIFQTNCF